MWLARWKGTLAALRPLPFSVRRLIITSQAASRAMGCACLAFGGVFGFAAENQEPHPAVADKAASGNPFKAVDYGERGLEFRTANGKNLLWLGFRLQMRYDSLPGPLASETESGVRFRLQWEFSF